jgi:hypothetical protein
VASVPVRRDAFEPATIKVAAGRPAAVPKPAGAAAAAPEEEEEVPEGPPPPPKIDESLPGYWSALKEWALMVRNGAAPTTEFPKALADSISTRYPSGEKKKELAYMNMFTWIYETVQTSTDSAERLAAYNAALSQVLLEMVWDTSLRPAEQQALLADELAQGVAREQIVDIGGRKAYRYVDPSVGDVKYICADGPCSAAVTQAFEANPDDAYRRLKCDRNTTGRIYGFIAPRFKDSRLIFKTGVPPAPGSAVTQGAQCANTTNISFKHITMLKEIGDLAEAEGYTRLFLNLDILNDAAKWKLGRPGEMGQARNARRACAIKEIVLRWLDALESQKAGGKGRRYFYRPISANKTGHKGK